MFYEFEITDDVQEMFVAPVEIIEIEIPKDWNV